MHALGRAHEFPFLIHVFFLLSFRDKITIVNSIRLQFDRSMHMVLYPDVSYPEYSMSPGS
uniref:Uncharacterized protein n=1 Tax=Anguilla anguilla TaxID=7936 RepID=A0A0E9RY18_ANGAN